MWSDLLYRIKLGIYIEYHWWIWWLALHGQNILNQTEVGMRRRAAARLNFIPKDNEIVGYNKASSLLLENKLCNISNLKSAGEIEYVGYCQVFTPHIEKRDELLTEQKNPFPNSRLLVKNATCMFHSKINSQYLQGYNGACR
jgi:hypothetical protein